VNAGTERAELVAAGARLAARGLAPGTSGNLSVRLADGSYLMTPTNASLASLDGSRLALIDEDGTPLSGDPPTKEAALHLAMYGARLDAMAVVHLHAPYSVALACLQHDDPSDTLPKLTPYAVMRVGALPLIPYAPPGDRHLADSVRVQARTHHAVLLANHGPVIAGTSLASATATAEEIEEVARLSFILRGLPTRPLDADQVAHLRAAHALR
jgi:ribulose-5-phosphate 4-epimerase/fuculose-1-phosphate aldolase